MLLRPKKLSSDRIYQIELKTGKFNEAEYKSTTKKQFMISSDYGYCLSCELLEPTLGTRHQGCQAPLPKDADLRGISNGTRHQRCQAPSVKIAILCHGFSQGKYRSLIYAEIFLKMGFRVLIYDHRNHGLSGRAFTSMGYYEKYDLKKLVDWCYKTYGSDCKIVTHGESMGAATALLHLGIDKRVICTIADCSYSDLKELLKHQVKHYYHMPLFLIPLESLVTYIRAGFWYGQVSPISVVSKVDTPILFIHGKKDNYVPIDMSKKMYKSKKCKKALYLVAGATHAQSCVINRKGYEERVRVFIEKYIDIAN
jgi:fermentation-respiration switch protein FrsA (DUF1100 family)